MKTLADIGEMRLVAHLKALSAAGRGVHQGIGDDAAVVDIGGHALLITVDTMVAGGHFLPGRMPWRLVGRKAMASSVSDIVAMNGIPRYAVVALSTPASAPVDAVDALYQGLLERARDYGVALVGGDTTRSSTLTISVTVTGEAAWENVVLRSGARAGDMLCVTGTLGASQAGLRWLLTEQQSDHPALMAHFDPAARLDVVQGWQRQGVRPRALTDISDGLATEIHNICTASRCGAIVEAAWLPVAPNAREVASLMGDEALDYALYWGEDYELIFTMPREELAALDRSMFTVIGQCLPPAAGVSVRDLAGEVLPLQRKGWEAFRPC